MRVKCWLKITVPADPVIVTDYLMGKSRFKNYQKGKFDCRVRGFYFEMSKFVSIYL